MSGDPQPCQAVGQGNTFVRMQEILHGNHGDGCFAGPFFRLIWKILKASFSVIARRSQCCKDIFQAIAAKGIIFAIVKTIPIKREDIPLVFPREAKLSHWSQNTDAANRASATGSLIESRTSL